jgi:hypothetical protein
MLTRRSKKESSFLRMRTCVLKTHELLNFYHDDGHEMLLEESLQELIEGDNAETSSAGVNCNPGLSPGRKSATFTNVDSETRILSGLRSP